MEFLIQQHDLVIATAGRGFVEISADLRELVGQSGINAGLCRCFVHHTSASMVIMENADPSVLTDLERYMARLVPDGDPLFTHTAEGPDDMSAHVRTALTHTDLAIPVREGRLDLGTWQGVFLWEHRARPHRRRITVTLMNA
ncbi:MAG: secondary thiamine-phosphate synthase enzyme YjbQ [Xanthomonadales bacterium]|nr:secondary thiamine-phosphate synthase enzyme YjbQ [Xanthomonadales bacterium]